MYQIPTNFPNGLERNANFKDPIDPIDFKEVIMANRALLVGVNKYRIAGSDLSGCVNDVTNMSDILLRHFGFTTKEIRILVDERATKKNILDRLKWLVNKAKGNDRLLFHFSGHGSQIVDILIPAQRRQSRCVS